MNKLIAVVLSLVLLQNANAQNNYAVDKRRVLFHDNIDKLQKKVYSLDGKADSTIMIARDETVNLQIEYALIDQVDGLQKKIELDSTLSHNAKLKYLRGLEVMLKGYVANYKKRDFPVTMAPALVNAFEQGMALDVKGQSIEPVVNNNIYAVGKILIDCFNILPENPGTQASKTIIIRKYLASHPDEILNTLKTNTDLPFTDSLIAVAAHNDPMRLYDFASAHDKLSSRIHSNQDSLVQTIVLLSKSKSGQLYFPFLDMLVKNKITIEEIDKQKENDISYYKLLVKTRIDYVGRVIGPQKDTPMEMDALTKMMVSKAKNAFISQINGLHDSPDPVRFKVLEPLSAQELYYLCVLGEEEIYTSSYIGVFKRIFQKMKVPRGDSLVLSVNADYFRKFIKMAAAYNTLNDFLKSMPQENATSLMRAFMFGLEKSATAKNMEDAVDVADSYSSIFEKNKQVAQLMLDEANWNYTRCQRNNDKNGQVVYMLEKTLFESADTSKNIDLAEKLGIPPIYSVNYSALVDDSGRIVQQVFFYGDEDKDGQNSYANFMSLFRGKPEWSIAENPNWVTIKSTKGKPVWIFANKPLYGENDPDAKAQALLDEYLSSKDIHPTIFIHRGHSYHVKYSLEQIQPTAKIVILGSCGGYNNLHDVLEISEDAHIISSKQVGTRTVNEPILEEINKTIRNGKNIEWMNMWGDLSKRFSGEAKSRFEDYIPPYKNLGALFIKAYKKQVDVEEE
jgi:hypothetical protein